MEKNKSYDKLVTYFFDMSKVCFTGLVIGVIIVLANDLSNPMLWGLLILGIASTIAFATIAYRILK